MICWYKVVTVFIWRDGTISNEIYVFETETEAKKWVDFMKTLGNVYSSEIIKVEPDYGIVKINKEMGF